MFCPHVEMPLKSDGNGAFIFLALFFLYLDLIPSFSKAAFLHMFAVKMTCLDFFD